MWGWGGTAHKKKKVDKLSLVCPDKRELDDRYGLILTQPVINNKTSCPIRRPAAASVPPPAPDLGSVFSTQLETEMKSASDTSSLSFVHPPPPWLYFLLAGGTWPSGGLEVV